MNKAWILASLPNLESAYKVGNIGETIGTITQDRSAGIAGKIGQGPPVVPVYVSVTDGARGINNSSRVEVIDDEVLLPAMLDAVAYNTVAKTMDREGGGQQDFLSVLMAEVISAGRSMFSGKICIMQRQESAN